jgi:protease-4
MRGVLSFALALALVPAATGAAPVPALPPAPYGNESVAATDDASGFFVNPAAGGLRYPSELMFSWTDPAAGPRLWRGAASSGGFALGGAHLENGPTRLSMGFAGGRDVRLGMRIDALRGAGGGERATDLALGVLARPAPWLALGAALEHAAQPRFMDALLPRTYTLGAGLRPLALSRSAAWGYGPRWTLTADVALREGAPNRSARARFGGEIEVLKGIALRGAIESPGGYRLGVALLGPNSGYHASAAFGDDDTRIEESHTITLHEAEDATVLDTRPGRVAVIRAGGALADETLAGGGLLDSGGGTPTLWLHRQLERALEDPKTRGVLLDLRGISGMAQVEELRPKIRRLRDAGKPVVAYLEYGAGRAGLMLASACDRVVTTPGAYYRSLGLRIEQRFYRGLLERWGVRLERASHGPYKSAYRNFSVDSSTAEDREVFGRILDENQRLFVDAVTADRGMSADRLAPILDGRDWPGADLQSAGLVDSLGYREDALRILGGMTGLGAKPREANLAKLPLPERAWRVPARIAVVYASGGMELGESGNDLVFGPFMGARTITRQIEAAFRNREVGAVVLRIDSPGGATLASDLIHHTVERMKRETKKPLIVSMAASAASGGYHMAVPADRIFANRFTYTGSIGVFYVKPSFEGLYANWGVRQEDFERGRYMRGLSPSRNWDAEIQASADSAAMRSYRVFVDDVARGRGMTFAGVDSVALGRVWMGDDARARGLVDEIGTLEDAIAEARRRAGVPPGEKIRPLEYRRPGGGFFERLLQRYVGDWIASRMHLPDPGASYHRADPPLAE